MSLHMLNQELTLHFTKHQITMEIKKNPTMPTTIGFSSLSGEVRNQIYEYVLTSSSRIRYLDNTGTSRPKPIFYEGKGCFDSGREFDESATQHNRTLHISPPEFNQLKYVNRQLHEETAGLELKYNELDFVAPVGSMEPCGRQLINYMTCLKPSMHAWLTTVTVGQPVDNTADSSSFMSDSYETVNLLDQICHKHSHIKVRVILPGWRLCPDQDENPLDNFIGRGLLFAWSLRGDSCLSIFSSIFHEQTRRLSMMTMHTLIGRGNHSEHGRRDNPYQGIIKWGVARMHRLTAPNLRFVPVVMLGDGGLAGLSDLHRVWEGMPRISSEAVLLESEEWISEGI
jgi:hypothetical protein